MKIDGECVTRRSTSGADVNAWIGRNRGPIRALQRCRSMANVGAERLLKIPNSKPERHFPSGAAQTRMVSVAKIRLDRRKSTRLFKGIICDDVSEFESHMPSHAVGSLYAI
jgi:hypothetical protein